MIVNGWYFYSINWLNVATTIRNSPSYLRKILTEPRRVAGIIPPTVRYSIPVFERDWREEIQPRYRATVAEAAAQVETIPVAELPALVDDLADHAGRYFALVAALAGAAYKMEMNLAIFYRRHLAKTLGGSHLPLVSGFELEVVDDQPSLVSLDWWFEPVTLPAASMPRDAGVVIAARREAEAAAIAALAGSPRRQRSFRRLLAQTQRLVPIREEQVREFTLPWPVMRRAVIRIGEELAARVIAAVDDVFFLRRAEVAALPASAPAARSTSPSGDGCARSRLGWCRPISSASRTRSCAASGRPFRSWSAPNRRTGDRHGFAGVTGSRDRSGAGGPSARRVRHAPGRRDPRRAGDGASLTPLFARAAAVVTDVGSAAAHASIVAREYGIPAVVGCGDATARLRTGMRVTVDGSTGNVEPA